MSRLLLRCGVRRHFAVLLFAGLSSLPAGLVAETNTEGSKQQQKTTDEQQDKQEQSQEELEFRDENLGAMNNQEARAAGFVFEDRSRRQPRATATFIAMTGGTVIHGLGHWYRGDGTSATKLLIGEGAGLALVGAGLGIREVSSERPVADGIGRALAFAGGGLFGLTYLADIIGSFSGPSERLPANSRWHRGIHVSASYEYNEFEGRPGSVLQFLTVESQFDFQRVYFGFETDQELSFFPAAYGATVGLRPWLGPTKDDFLFWETDLEWYDVADGPSLHRVSGDSLFGLSLDLGKVVSHLEGFAVGMAVGYGREWYGETSVGDSWPALGSGRYYLPFETFAHFNLNDRLNARFEYDRRLGVSRDKRRVFDRFTGELLYRGGRIFDLHVAASVGSGFAVRSGLTVRLWK